jgi:cytochrome c peroxidase
MTAGPALFLRLALAPVHVVRAFGLLALCLGISGCSGSSTNNAGAGAGTGNSTSQTLSSRAQLGDKIFHDVTLSASGQQSCATCHDQSRAFASSDDLAVPLGGSAMDRQGRRNAPSLKYLDRTPAFYFDDEGTPTGGFDRDGRADSLAAQVEGPFLTDFEMGNASATEVVDKLSRARYAADFRREFGDDIFNNVDQAFLAARLALQAYQQQDSDFHPYSSKYDAFLVGKASLTDQELRGLAAFNDPVRGNCAGCHPSGRGADGSLPLFTDFTYDNLGVPRNTAIAANDDDSYFDLGLCGPLRTDLADRSDLCGAFKVPTLRNIELTAPYFHNGRFTTLKQALEFYVRRDTNPEEFYPLDAHGVVNKFDDLPAAYKANVNTTEVPYNRQPGDQPALNANEIDDVIAFLKTLTDGYQP